MVWTTRNSLNRWCLRSLHENSDAPADALLQSHAGAGAIALQRCKGRPPLMNACIAPHCDAWNALDEERGICVLRENLKFEIKIEGK